MYIVNNTDRITKLYDAVKSIDYNILALKCIIKQYK